MVPDWVCKDYFCPTKWTLGLCRVISWTGRKRYILFHFKDVLYNPQIVKFIQKLFNYLKNDMSTLYVKNHILMNGNRERRKIEQTKVF